ncbi:hypothetical protein [Amycolatopsis sp. DG1A-15b]|uniref:hypothetical protein n=1 Tax=Amycolatopsis sp. DG1A-15b TaxID=3052846 RepID=UPI00255B5BC8|nr:hypothetical protein [Amycolatopsis sp. DG1A-15b]WIX88462.1 hypothetical protein QRY02_46340 [Amycolatopsis sp. DG1A-15b]
MVKKTLIGLMAASAATVALTAPAHADQAVVWSLTQQVEPGGQIQAVVFAEWEVGCTPAGPVTSRGFTAPLKWTEGGEWGRHAGYTTAGRRPGKYTAAFPCTDGRKATGSFTITGTPPPGTTTHPKPTASTPTTPKSKPTATATKPAKPAKPQVAVKPAGAPQTGDGTLG